MAIGWALRVPDSSISFVNQWQLASRLDWTGMTKRINLHGTPTAGDPMDTSTLSSLVSVPIIDTRTGGSAFGLLASDSSRFGNSVPGGSPAQSREAAEKFATPRQRLAETRCKQAFPGQNFGTAFASRLRRCDRRERAQ